MLRHGRFDRRAELGTSPSTGGELGAQGGEGGAPCIVEVLRKQRFGGVNRLVKDRDRFRQFVQGLHAFFV